jgi:hypothetical protein
VTGLGDIVGGAYIELRPIASPTFAAQAEAQILPGLTAVESKVNASTNAGQAALRGLTGEVANYGTAAASSLGVLGGKVEQTAAQSVGGLSRIGTIARSVDGQLATFGLPFGGALAAVSKGLDATQTKATSFGQSLANLGQKEAVVGGLALATVGVEAVHLADTFETAHARMDTAILDSGHQQSEYDKQLSSTEKTMEKYGFTHAQTEDSISKLIPVTGSASKAIADEAAVANLAAGRHTSLEAATTALVRVEGGRYTLLGRLIGLSQTQVNSIHSEADAVNLITQLYGGQAAAAADTFAGSLKTLSATGQDLGVGIGNFIIPQVEHLVTGLLAGVNTFQSINAATDGWTGRLVLVGAAIPLVFLAGEKLISVGEGVVSTYGRVASTLGLTTSAAEAEAAANVAAAQTAATAAGERVTSEGIVQAAIDQRTASTFAAIAAESADAAETITTSSVRIAAEQALAAARVNAATASAAADDFLIARTYAAADATVVLTTAEERRAASKAGLLTATEAQTAADAQQIALDEADALATANLESAEMTAALAADIDAAAQTGVGMAAATAGEGSAFAALGIGTLAEAEGGAAVAGSALDASLLPVIATVGVVAATFATAAGVIALHWGDNNQTTQAIEADAKALNDMGAAAKAAQADIARIVVPKTLDLSFSTNNAGKQAAADIANYAKELRDGATASQLLASKEAMTLDTERALAAGFVGSAKASQMSQEQLDALKVTNSQYATAVRMTTDEERYAIATLDALTKQYGASGVQTLELSAAQKQYADDLVLSSEGNSAATARLADDKAAVTAASTAQTDTQNQVNAATDAGTAAAAGHAPALSAEQAAIEGVAQSASNAASALASMEAESFAATQGAIDSHKVTSDLTSALAALHTAGTAASSGGGGGGGAHTTAAQAALDQQQKELALRDALKTVHDETFNLQKANEQLTASRTAEKIAAADVIVAESNLRSVLHGVAADTKVAQDAQESLTKARLDAQSAVLDVHDAELALGAARAAPKTDAATNAAAVAAASTAAGAAQTTAAQQVQQAEQQLAEYRAANLNPATIAVAETNLATTKATAAAQVATAEKTLQDAKTLSATTQTSDNEKIQRAEIALAEARLRNHDVTVAQTEAQRIYTGTVQGFPPASAEAKAAQDQLTTALTAGQSASDAVTSALNGVRDVQDQVATHALALQRAQDELNGSLVASSGSGGGPAKAAAALDNFQTKLDAAATAAQAEATNAGKAIEKSTGSVAAGMLTYVESLQSVVDTEPLLAAALDPAINAAKAKLVAMSALAFAGSNVGIVGGQVVDLSTSAGRAASNAAHPHGNQSTAANAAGGIGGPNEVFTVGEEGFELARGLPTGGVEILSNPQSRHLLGTSTVSLSQAHASASTATSTPSHADRSTSTSPSSATGSHFDFRGAIFQALDPEHLAAETAHRIAWDLRLPA